MALNLKVELELVVDVLGLNAAPFAICGAVAVTIHGAPRFTKDIDLLVPSVAIEQIKRLAATVGFTFTAAPMTFEAGTPRERTIHRVSKADPPDLLTLDLIEARGLLLPAWDSRVVVEWEGRRVPVVSRDGLLLMKRLAGRPQDLLDIQKLGEDHDEKDS